MEQKAEILDKFSNELREINRKSGTIYGTVQILERFEQIAIEKGFMPCPYCKRKV